MRIDHFAYQRATRIAGLGLLLQLLFGITWLVFGQMAGDSATWFASLYVFAGIFVWVSLLVIFHQHKLERLESLEIDELQASRTATGSAFAEDEETRLAARRLRLMHKWLMPAISLIVAIVLATLAAMRLHWFYLLDEGTLIGDFAVTDQQMWGMAICLGMAAVAFIFSRYVAGMAQQPAWQNLRGGAGYMVGNAIVALAIAVGIAFRYIDKESDAVIRAIAYAIPIYMLVVAAEIILNFLLNLYRPRKPGEVARPAFDSRLLSLLSAPDSIVRSINEAINYQFGFDLTGSWGYQLLLKRFRSLALFAVIILVLLNCMVVVEPHQQAVKLQGGRIVEGRVYGPGAMFKWPWPIQQANVYNIGRVRELALTARMSDSEDNRQPRLWSEELDVKFGFEPFLVKSSNFDRDMLDSALFDVTPRGANSVEESVQLTGNYALIEAEIVLQYRIRETSDGNGGLLDFIYFASDRMERRQRVNMRVSALKSLALREVTQYCSTQELDHIIGQGTAEMIDGLHRRIQATFDENRAGVEVLAVSVPWIRPAGIAARSFEELAYNSEQKKQRVAQARKLRDRSLTQAAGSTEIAERLYREINQLEDLRDEFEVDSPAVQAKEAEIRNLLLSAGGLAANEIASARADRWIRPLAEQARAKRFLGRLAAYRAGPTIYREYLRMDMLSYVLRDARKFFIGVDPELLVIDTTIQQDDSFFEAADGIPEEER